MGFKSLQNNSAWFLKLGSYFSVMSELRSLKGSPPQIIRNGIVLCKIIYVRGQVLANARSFIQRMWLIPRSLSGIYVFGHCSKIWMSFLVLVPKFHSYYLGSKSTEVLFWVKKVRVPKSQFQMSESFNAGPRWFQMSGSSNAGSKVQEF